MGGCVDPVLAHALQADRPDPLGREHVQNQCEPLGEAATDHHQVRLGDVASARTRIERTFDPEAVRQLKAGSDLALSVDGPHLAVQAIRVGLVDEYQLFVGPAIGGGGNPLFPDDVRVDLELLDERRFGNGVVYLRYGVTDHGPRGSADGRST